MPAADKTHNGQGFWSTFNASRDELLWYYTSVERAVAERLPAHSITAALQRAVDELAGAAGVHRANVPCSCRREPDEAAAHPGGRRPTTEPPRGVVPVTAL